MLATRYIKFDQLELQYQCGSLRARKISDISFGFCTHYSSCIVVMLEFILKERPLESTIHWDLPSVFSRVTLRLYKIAKWV